MGDVIPQSALNGEQTPAAPAAPPQSTQPGQPVAESEPGSPGATAPAVVPPAQPGDGSQPPASVDKTVPLSVLTAERKKFQERLRRARQGTADAPPDFPSGNSEELNQVRSHPYVQSLEARTAELQLRQGVSRMLRDYPDCPKSIRRAVLANPRGFVRPETKNVQYGILDVEDYIREQTDRIEADNARTPGGPVVPPGKKTVPVANTNVPATTQPKATPERIQKILAKPVDEWSKEDRQTLEEGGAPKL